MAKGDPPNRKYTTANRRNKLRRDIASPKMVEGGSWQYAAVRAAQAGVRSAAKAVTRQNKAANTYRTVDPARSAAAKKAAATRRANEKARIKGAKDLGRKQGAASGVLLGGSVAGVGSVASAGDKDSKPKAKAKSAGEPPNRTYTSSNKKKASTRAKTSGASKPKSGGRTSVAIVGGSSRKGKGGSGSSAGERKIPTTRVSPSRRQEGIRRTAAANRKLGSEGPKRSKKR